VRLPFLFISSVRFSVFLYLFLFARRFYPGSLFCGRHLPGCCCYSSFVLYTLGALEIKFLQFYRTPQYARFHSISLWPCTHVWSSMMTLSRSSDDEIIPIIMDVFPTELPQRPTPAASADLSRAPSYRETTACNSPRTWSFEGISKDADHVQTVTYYLTLQKYDDVDLMPKWKKTHFRFSPVTTLGAVGSYILYFVFRNYCTWDSQLSHHKTYWLAWFFIVAEALVACKFGFARSKNKLM